jgi:hypothetical protein
MKVASVMEVCSASHVALYVEGPFEQRGSLMFVAPPGALKSTLIRESLSFYPDVISLSDLNVASLGHLKTALISGKYNSIAFGEFEKLYERNPGSAINLEGHIRALIEEGFDKMSYQTPEMNSVKARVLVVGGITPFAYEKRYQGWLNSGFARRFIWSHWRLNDEATVTKAIREWKKINFGKVSSMVPANRTIKYCVQKRDHAILEKHLDFQPSKETPYVLYKKIFCVLVWRYGRGKALRILEDFSESLKPGGATLYL